MPVTVAAWGRIRDTAGASAWGAAGCCQDEEAARSVGSRRWRRHGAMPPAYSQARAPGGARARWGRAWCVERPLPHELGPGLIRRQGRPMRNSRLPLVYLHIHAQLAPMGHKSAAMPPNRPYAAQRYSNHRALVREQSACRFPKPFESACLTASAPR